MRATSRTLHERLSKHMGFMHAARWQALWLTALGLLEGQRLWLTALGRARPGNAARRHAIKAVDRLLSNGALYVERKRVYHAIVEMLLPRGARPAVLVDTVEVLTGVVSITASLACDGRSFPVFSAVTDKIKPPARELRKFLVDLGTVLPDGCKPIIITDAGFESEWFDAVCEMGWDYVGRLRNRTHFYVEGRWTPLAGLHQRATSRARSLGQVQFPKIKSRRGSRRIVLSKKRKSSHRKRLTSRGKPGQRKDDYRHGRGANEPWVLATSLTSRASYVVGLYALRMQIEEVFRDTKNHRWGWSFRHCRTRTKSRLEILLLVAALGYLMQQLIGSAGEALNLHRRHQANTITQRRVLSHFVLGALLLRSADLDRITQTSLRWALSRTRKRIREHGDFLE